jgi:hypothetical protein
MARLDAVQFALLCNFNCRLNGSVIEWGKARKIFDGCFPSSRLSVGRAAILDGSTNAGTAKQAATIPALSYWAIVPSNATSHKGTLQPLIAFSSRHAGSMNLNAALFVYNLLDAVTVACIRNINAARLNNAVDVWGIRAIEQTAKDRAVTIQHFSGDARHGGFEWLGSPTIGGEWQRCG